MASGAFPVAFQPVLVKRYPQEFKAAYDLSELEKNGGGTQIFAYADGGAFNNEPIKEAFKLGYFQDFQNTTPTPNQDRLILFVDPAVPDQVRFSQLASLDPLQDLDKKAKSKAKGETEKLTAIFSDLAGMIIRQSKINEEAKVQKFYQTALLKQSITAFLGDSKRYDFTVLNKSQLVKFFTQMANTYLKSRQLSIGTREIGRLIYKKYMELCGSEDVVCLTPEGFDSLMDILSAKEREYSIGEIKEFLQSKGCSPDHQDIVAKSILMAITEFSLNQSGKSEYAERAGIFPIDNQFEIEKLPGSELSAFAGFVDKNARNACFVKGRLDAIKCLSSNSFRKYHQESLKQILPEANAYIDRVFTDILATRLESEYNTHKNAYQDTIKGIADGQLRDMLINRLMNLAKENYSTWNRVLLVGAAVFGVKRILKGLLKKDTLSKMILFSDTIPLKLRLPDSKEIKFVLAGQNKVKLKAISIGPMKLCKIYMHRPRSGEKIQFSLTSKRNAWKNTVLNPINAIELNKETYDISKLADALSDEYDSLFREVNPICSVSINPGKELQVQKIDLQKDFATQLLNHRNTTRLA